MKMRIAGTLILLNAIAFSQAQQMPVTVPSDWPNAPSLQKQRDVLLKEMETLREKVKVHNASYSRVKAGSPEEAAGRTEMMALQKEIDDYIARVKAFNTLVARNPPASTTSMAPGDSNDQAAHILAGIRKIKVPPPIPPEQAVIAFGQTIRDEHSEHIILGTEIGAAAFNVVGILEEASLPTHVILATGKVFIEQENGADLYLVKENDKCEQALAYLKNEKTRAQFAEILKNLRDNKPLPENARIDMVRAAQAITDPRLGGSGMHMAWSAMMSPEARHAALTQATIELGGHILGSATEAAVGRLAAARNPAFTEAKDFLLHAEVALQHVNDPATVNTLNQAIAQANEIIAHSYEITEPAAQAAGRFIHIDFTTNTHAELEKK